MRKKISSILMGILLVLAGVFASACGDKYKDFEFKVLYAFEEDAKTWYAAGNDISLNYSVDDKGTPTEYDDEYVFDFNGKEERVQKRDFNLFIKVEVDGVKSEHIDSITISAENSNGLAFSSSTVKEGKAVKLGVVGVVNSQLSLYENQSAKSKKINLSIYGKLEDLSLNANTIPAVVVGDSVNLNSVLDANGNGLVLYNKEMGATTNQTGVEYTIQDFGSFAEDGVYVEDSVVNNQFNTKFVSVSGGKLKLNKSIRTMAGTQDFELNAQNNVIRLLATSIHNSEITEDVYVHIVPDDLVAPTVVYAEGVKAGVSVNDEALTYKGLDLYVSKDNLYSSSKVSVVLDENLYSLNEIKTSFGETLSLQPFVYVGNNTNPYDFEYSGAPQRDLLLERNDDTYTFKLVNRSTEEKVDVKVAYKLVADNGESLKEVIFTNAAINLSTNIAVRKHVLASNILANGEELANGDVISGVVLSTSNPNYTGYELELAIDPIDTYALEKQTNEIFGIDNLVVKDENDFTVTEGDKIAPYNTLYFKYKNSVSDKQFVTIRTKKTPYYFNGELFASPDYIQITLELEKKVTADKLEVVDGKTFEPVSSVKVGANKESSVFVKAYHTGTLDLETVTIESSAFGLNAKGDTSILLNADNVVTSPDWNVEGYSIYKITIPQTATADGQNATLTVFAGEKGKGAKAEVSMQAVNLVTNVNKISIVPNETTYVETFGNNKFAIVRDKEVQFNVVESLDKEYLHNTVKIKSIQGVKIEDATISSYFGGATTLKADAVPNTNIFKVEGWENKTRVFNVTIEYYDKIDDVVTLQTKVIENVQFAVYNPITSIIASIQKELDGKTVKDSIVYVNQLFADAAMTQISYTSHSGVADDVPTQKIYFVDSGILEERNNVSGVQISIDENLSEVSAVKIWYLLNTSFNLLDNQQMLLENAAINSSVRLQLDSSYVGRLGVTFSFVAKQFGKVTSVQDTATVYFKNVDKAIGLDIKGDIHAYSSTDREMQISFMGVEGNEVSKSFTAEPKYSTTNQGNDNFKRFNEIEYLLYKYTLNNGEIVYESDGVTPKLTQITDVNKSLKVSIAGSVVTVTADKTLDKIGGLYKLVIATMDSYNDTNGTFATTYSLNVRVSDGSSVDSAYIITNSQQFLAINDDLDAHYVLGDIITLNADDLTRPIGSESNSVKPFTGSLSGKLYTVTESGFSNISNYAIYATVSKNIQASSSSYLYGLFSILEGKISNLNVYITFGGISTPEGDDSNIAGIAAINRGTIENVSLYLSGSVEINNITNFGGVAAINESGAIIKNCKVECVSAGVSITAKIASNIGLVVGQNAGEISGRYQGKDSLEQVSYDVVANLTIRNTVENIPYNIGAVAGESSSAINNILVGGKINVISKNGVDVNVALSGYLAGVVGQSTGSLLTVATLGLDLNNADKDGIKIAGIAGVADVIEDARYISAVTTFKFGKTYGQLIGKDVAGISFSAKVSYATVESFIKTINNGIFYNMVAENVYGLVETGSVNNSFVNANIDATSAYLTSNISVSSNIANVYFIGNVNGARTDKSTYSVVYNKDAFVEVKGFVNNNPLSFIKDKATYISNGQTLKDYLVLAECDAEETLEMMLMESNLLVYGSSDEQTFTQVIDVSEYHDYSFFYTLTETDLAYLYYNVSGDDYQPVGLGCNIETELFNQEIVQYFDQESWIENIDDLAGFEIDPEYNKVAVGEYTWFFPYLKDANNNILMILQPTYIKAEINSGYQISTEQNIYVDKVEIEDDATPPTYTIKESIIVDFFGFTSLFEDHTEVNKHYLIKKECLACKEGKECTSGGKCHNGLIDLEMLPVTAGLNFEIIGNGVDYANIIDNTYIQFTGASNGEAIIVRVYSVFNAEVEVYIAFYSQQTYTSIKINGNNIDTSASNDADFVLTAYQGKANNLLSITGDNAINGNKYQSIFERSEMKTYIKLETGFDSNILNVNADTLSTISVSIKDDYTIETNGDDTLVTFKVWLDKSYFGSARTEDLLLGEVTLKVLMFNIAEGLEIIGADSFEIESSGSVSLQASLKTGLIDTTDSTINEEELQVKFENGVVIVSDSDAAKVKDSIRMTILSSGSEVSKLLETTGVSHIVDLFNFDVYSIRNDNGYTYFVTVELKDEFDYRYITSNIEFELQIWAESNEKIQNSVEVLVKPTTVNTTRFANYAVEKIAVVSDTKSELTRGNVETSIISPGGRGNILVAHIEKSYSNIDSISITSSELFVPSLNRKVNLMFSQLVYNTTSKKFETLFNAGLTSQEGNTLQLQKVTSIVDGKEVYTGIIYIHVQLVKFSGLESSISASLNVTSNGKELAATTKTFTTTFLPGADLYYTGYSIADGYLIQEETYLNSAKIQLQGYQFNSNPIMDINWEIADGVEYFYKLDNVVNKEISASEEILEAFKADNLFYKEANKYYKAKYEEDCQKAGVTFYVIANKKTIVKSSTEYIVSDFVSYSFVKDFTEVTYNSVDGSYTMEVKFNVAKDLLTNFSMQAILNLITKDGQFETAKSDALKFYPTKYVITDVAVANTAGNKKMLAINRTDKFELLFTTQRADYDYSAEIYNDVFTKVDNGGINVENLKNLFSYYNQTNLTFADNSTEFLVAIREGYLTLTGLSKFQSTITLSMYIGYNLDGNGKYSLVFSEGTGVGMSKFEYMFDLVIYPGAGEENATPIYHNYEMFDSDGNCLLAENGHYILMNDLTFDVVKPIEYAIGSLDGNNKVIKIKNFAMDATKQNYGLFANIGTYKDEEQRSHKTILKNVVVDYSEYNAENGGIIDFTTNTTNNIVFGGLVAVNNGGLIYNCDVLNYGLGEKTINVLVKDDAKITFGGLVGTNSGNITNSRVGRSTFVKIDAANDITTNNIPMGSLTFVLGDETFSGFDVVSGGLVGINSGNVSSSYFANSSLINYSNSKDENLTAGFVGRNTSNGKIMYSYVKAMENTISSTMPYASGAKIEGKSNTIIAGFVYENGGSINDCYANTMLHTKSTYMAGFVYNNSTGATAGTISECYAACTMKVDKGAQDDAEQPFVGKNNEGTYLDYGTIENAYYLISNDGSGEVGSGAIQALNATNFKNPNNLFGFVFVQSNVVAEREQGVWSHVDTKGYSVILPELMNANKIAHSAKYLISGNGIEEKFTYTNASSYLEGSQNNPYIIRNIDEFNDIFTGNRTDMSTPMSKSGYVRMIDSIDFGQDETAIKTRVKYTLGDSNKANITSFEGNGMSINGIYFDVSEPGIRELGLFAKIQNAYVKNVNLNFVEPKTGGQYSTTLVKYSGGLAGIISNSAIINVTLNGSNVSLTGQNFVGGLAGLVEGSSLLYGISSNLSAVANYNGTNLYYSKTDYVAMGNSAASYDSYVGNLSYAGGLAGVIDITRRANTEYNVAYIDIYGNEMFKKTSENGVQLANISGQYAGGVAGFASKNATGLKLKYHTGLTDWISGSYAAGGIYGVSLGTLTASQVTADEDIQYNYDTKFGDYIINLGSKALDTTALGNLNLIESSKYAGGLVGVGINAGINASYSKAAFKDGEIIGGLIGASIASNITYSYAVPYVNVTDNNKLIGGLIGAAHMVNKGQNIGKNSTVRIYEDLLNLYLRRDVSSPSELKTDIQYTFSTILMNKADIVERAKLWTNENKILINYIAPSFTNNTNTDNIVSGGNTTYTGVYAGTVDYSYSTIPNAEPNMSAVSTIEVKAKNRELKVLYDFEHALQEPTFNEIFLPWATVSYWSIRYEKYFPLLTNEGVDNYIIIENAEDLKMVVSNPDGKYLVVNDIDVGIQNSNWLFDCEFTGELLGQVDSNSNVRKKLYNIGLKPNQAVESSGLFRKTMGANISNLEFVWADGGNGAIDTTANGITKLTSVAGLSCFDEPDKDENCSEFNNVEVRVDNFLIKQPATGKVTINSFAGLIASTKSSSVNDCSFVGKVDISLGSVKPDASDSIVYFGGLIGVAQKSTEITDSNMSIMNSKLGANGEDLTIAQSEFNIEIANAQEAYIGGLIAEITNASIYSGAIGGIGYEKSYRTIPYNITISQTEECFVNIGGLAAQNNDSAINYCNVNSNITVVGEESVNSNIYLGAMIADFTFASNNITATNAKVDIDVSKLKANNILLSSGVASLSSRNDANPALTQCLITGSIIAENGTDILTANSITYGSVVASVVDEGKAKISETFSTAEAIVGTNNSAAHTLIAGGFVGYISDKSSLKIENCAVTGKLVPICGETATAVSLGGFIGSLEDSASATINNSYTLTSIIADAIHGKALAATSSDAVVGYANSNVTTTNVYFSTDITLTTNNNNLGTNLNAVNLVGGATDCWKAGFASNGMWKYVEVDKQRVPFIKSLEDNLKKYGVLKLDVGSNKFDYVLGTVFNPILDPTEFVEESFNYYIITGDKGSNISNSVDLNGVLIGNDSTIKYTSSTVGYITTISKHSAVSNLHFELVGTMTYDTVGGTAVHDGIIAETNNGLMFNCSVQGNGLKLKFNQIGLIAGANNGTISYCYSSAEIIEVVGSVGGIVYENNGYINTCYFTGYINNDARSAGIVVNTTASSFTFNSYMAGVVEGLNDKNSFFAGDTLIGLNNYIDQYANIEDILESNADGSIIISTLKTAELMAKADLRGNWYFTVTDGYIISDAISFGKNYGYPIYRFNKLGGDNKDSLTCSDLNFSLNTGTGLNANGTTFNTTIEARSNAINNDMYESAYKIPHLGVMSAVHGLLGTSRNYVTIYPIDAKMTNWTAVGSDGEAQGFKSTGGFNGLFVSNAYLKNSYNSGTGVVNVFAIEGLNNHGLFDRISDAYFGNLYLGSFGKIDTTVVGQNGLQSSGPLGKTVVGSVTVNNVSYKDDSIIEGTNVSALFGEINIDGTAVTNSGATEPSADVKISYFNTLNEAGSYHSVTLKGNGTAGLIAYKLSKGNVELCKDIHDDPTNALYPFMKKFTTGGGVVGEMSGGTLVGNGHSVNLNLATNIDERIANLGGLVGKASNGEATNAVDNLIVNFYMSEGTVISANTFGGFVAIVQGNISFDNCSITAPTANAELKFNSQESGTNGLVVGSIIPQEDKATSSITVSNFNMTNIAKLTFTAGSSGSNSAIGGIVGSLEGDLIFNYGAAEKLEIISENVMNVGGLIGIYKGGNINIAKYTPPAGTANVGVAEDSGSESPLTIKGYKNVGGFIGLAEKFPSIVDGSINFLNHSAAYAEIIINEKSTDNFGGIFGVLKATNIQATSEPEVSVVADEELTKNNFVEVKNKNVIKFIELEKDKQLTVSNIGGVVGFVEGEDILQIGNMTNESKFEITQKQYTIKNIGGVVGQFKGSHAIGLSNKGEISVEGVADHAASNAEDPTEPYSTLFNVGGTIGFVSSKEDSAKIIIKDLANESIIQGYQNVGGLIGYVTNAEIKGNIVLADGKSSIAINSSGTFENGTLNSACVTNKISGVVNVGGAVGYAGESTIQNIYVSGKASGNVNVGGLVGLSNVNTLENNYVGQAVSGAEKVEIKGIYYNFYFKNAAGDIDYVAYIPTSVGGLVGTSVESIISGCIINNVDVTSTKEGEETGSANSNSKGMISTIENYMVKVGSGEGSSGADHLTSATSRYILGGNGANERKVKYNETESGFGGFVGTIGELGFVDKENKKPSYMCNVNIEAPLGINVGTYYGTFVYDSYGFKAPILYGDAKVNGGYNIGGIAGKLSSDSVSAFSNANLQGDATINLQPSLTGMYVGGLFGEVQSNSVQGLTIENGDVGIKVNTSLSYYIGGLVGKLTVDSANTFVGTSTQITVVGDSAQNFGGLVGMFKIKTNSGGTFKVNGKQNYPFTVNTIENQNYDEGKSQFDTALFEDQGYVQLLAQAYYINKDSFSISATANTAYYDSSAKNPLRSDSSGWAKEYTGFKQVQRCIPGGSINGADSIAFVYNAENITHVGTLLNTGLKSGSYCTPDCGTSHTHTTIRYGQPSESTESGNGYYYNGDSGWIKMSDQFIIYTVYEKEYGYPMMYTPMGIAEVAKMQNGTLVTSSSNVYTQEQEKLGVEKAPSHSDRKGLEEYYFERSIMDKTFAGTTDKGFPKDKPYASLGSAQNLLKFDWNGKIGEDNIKWYYNKDDDDALENDQKDGLYKAYYYELGGKYYDFKVIYANRTLEEAGANSTVGLSQDLGCPKSGSVFEISGMNPDFNISSVDAGTSAWKWWHWVLAGVGLAILIALIVVSIVFTAGGASGFWAGLGTVLTASVGGFSLTTLIILGALALVIAMFAQIGAQGVGMSMQMFYSTHDQNLGLLTTTTTTQIRYKDNKLSATGVSTKKVIDTDGTVYEYQYYSTERPADYYTNHFIALVTATGDLAGVDDRLNSEQSLTSGVSYAEIQSDVNGDGNQIYEISASGGKNVYGFHYGYSATSEINAYKKYIYSEGVYYFNNMAYKWDYYQTQELTNFKNVKYNGNELTEAEKFTASNGRIYVRGDYSAGTYTYNPFGGNLMTSDYKLNTVPLGDAAYYDSTETFAYLGSYPKAADGYSLLAGAYYTADGKSSATDASGNSLKRYATFTSLTSKPSDFDQYNGSNYLSYTFSWPKLVGNDSEGKPVYETQSETKYYSISSVAITAGSTTYVDMFGVNTSLTNSSEIPSSLFINIYPKSFTNPYKNSVTNTKDDAKYINVRNKDSEAKYGVELTAAVRYFYFENGYKLGKDLPGVEAYLDQDDQLTHVKTSKESSFAQSVFVQSAITFDWKDQTIMLYDSNGNKVKDKGISYGTLFMNSNGDAFASSVNSTYLDYYTIDTSTDLGKAMKDLYKVRNTYYISDGILYERNDMYSLKNGCLYKLYIYNTESDSDSYSKNKYLSNAEYSLSTMFRYNGAGNFKFTKETSVWKDEDGNSYYIIPLTKNSSRPNGLDTYLVETGKVTLGGGLSLNYTGGGSGPSGRITIEDYQDN